MNKPNNTFDEDYFMRGRDTGVSLYENYRWLPDLTIPMARALVAHLAASQGDTFLDFGCARGFLVRALQELGHVSYGYDVSHWATQHCDGTVAGYVTSDWATLPDKFDWVIAKDVLEHIPSPEHMTAVSSMLGKARKGVFVVVPVAAYGAARERAVPSQYVVPEYELDVTHVQRLTYLEWWLLLMETAGPQFQVAATHRVPGIKDNYYESYPDGNAFFTITPYKDENALPILES